MIKSGLLTHVSDKKRRVEFLVSKIQSSQSQQGCPFFDKAANNLEICALIPSMTALYSLLLHTQVNSSLDLEAEVPSLVHY
jgi:hypothetical protein